MSVTNKDIWPVLKDLFLEQYKGHLRTEIEAQGCTLPEGADNRFQGLLKAVIDKLMQPLDDACVELQELLDIDTATGVRLDFIGKLANLKRGAGESDSSFKERVIGAFFSDNEGTPDYAIMMASQLSGDTAPQYMDEAPATFMVYTGPRQVVQRGENVLTEGGQEILTEGGESVETEPVSVWEEGGRQLSRSQVRKLAPCGVLGLPAAAIQFYDGTLLCDYDHKLIVMAADDANVEREILLINDGGNIMTTSQQSAVKVTIRGDSRYQTTPIHVDGVPGTIDGIRVKDLPDAQNDDAYMMRDSDVGGTTKAGIIGADDFDDIWENTPPAPADDE